MINNLPRPIALYVEADNTGDPNLLDQCFAENSTVRDENETYKGLASIKKWKAETKTKYQHTVEPLRLVEQDGKFVLTNKLAGNFSGSPIELDFVFTVQGDKIMAIEILS